MMTIRLLFGCHFDYFSKTSELDFTAIDIPGFLRVDLSGSMAAPSIRTFALTMPFCGLPEYEKG